MLLPDPADWPVTDPVTVPIVQLKLAPPGVLVRVMLVVPPLQMAAGETGFTTGFGFTVCTMLTGALGQPLSVPVTTYVTVPLPVKVWAMLLPEPAAWPVTLPVTVPIVQLKLAPDGVLVSVMLVVPPLQMAAGETGFTVGAELTVTTTSSVDAVQGEFEIVQRSVYTPAPPAGVNVAVRFAVLLNWALDVLGPLTTDHWPVPTLGLLAASVALEPAQID